MAETSGGLAKAYLELFEGSASGALTKTGLDVSKLSPGSGQKIDFQFNPKEFQIQKKANWKSSPSGKSKAPPAQYTGPDPASMTLEMFLDASEADDGDVTEQVQKLVEACIPTKESTGKNKPLPPFVMFGWDKVYFVGYIESVTAKYTLFRETGRPVRALCTLTLKELAGEKAKQNPTSGTPVLHRSIKTIAGDSLAGIAYREYGDPNLWRTLGDANGIDNPMRLPSGTSLMIPTISNGEA